MLDSHALYEYSLSLDDSHESQELQRRLELFQVFSRLYDRCPDLLNEILALEGVGVPVVNPSGFFYYVYAIVLNQQAYLLSNLVSGQSQALSPARNVWVIGRDRDKSSLALRDKRLSRQHAAIQYRSQWGDFQILDLGSTNGTFVNGERVQQQAPLRDGDRIRMASLTFSFFICPELPIKEAQAGGRTEVDPLPNLNSEETLRCKREQLEDN